jgi:hypothetical protein
MAGLEATMRKMVAADQFRGAVLIANGRTAAAGKSLVTY